MNQESDNWIRCTCDKKPPDVLVKKMCTSETTN